MGILKNVIELLLNPLFIAILLLTIATFLLRKHEQANKIRLLMFPVLFCLLVISTGWLPKYLTDTLEGQYPVVKQVDTKIQWVVVLSGGEASVKDLPANARLYTASIKRLVEGVRLLRLLPNARLVLSGGGYGHDDPEATLMAEVATWFNIPKAKIQLETLSLNTDAQAYQVKTIVGSSPFYLVTSAIHLPRSMALFSRLGMHPIPAPTDFTFVWTDERWGKTIIPNAYNVFYFNVAMHEMMGRLWTKLTSPL